MSRKRSIGTNDNPRAICRGNPRRPSAAMSGAVDAQPLGGNISRVTKQKITKEYARPSYSLDSISDEEDSREPKSVRSHLKPNKDFDAFAEIREPRTPQVPHDPSKPPKMTHRDLPSLPVSYRLKGGSGSTKPMNSLTRSLSSESNGISSSDEYAPMHKISRLSTKMEMKEEAVGRLVADSEGFIRKTSNLRSTIPSQTTKNERVVEMRNEVEVEMPKPQVAHVVHKKEIKEETKGRSMKNETSDEEEEERERSHARLKMKKARPAEELEVQRQMKAKIEKREFKVKEEDIITID